MKRINLSIIGLLILSVFACAQIIKPTQMEVLNQYESINALDKAVVQAKANSVDTYAPQGFQKAENSLDEAIKLAQSGEKDKAVALSNEGLGTIQLAQENAERTKMIMWEVRAIRQKAIKAGAVAVSMEAFGKADNKFQQANALVEKGKTETAKEYQPELIQIYSNLEKNALDKGIVELAKIAFEQAKNLEAETYAPKYFEKAEKELNLALDILDTDRSRTAEANAHAKLAARWARNAGQISALAKTFTLRDFSYEDTVLWYWQQLEIINAPFKDEIDFEQPNHVVIQSIQKKITDLEQAYANSQLLSKKQQEYADLLQKEHSKEISALTLQRNLYSF